MKKILILIVLMSIYATSFSQKIEWSKYFSSTNAQSRVHPREAVFSKDGYLIIVGTYTGSIDFDPSPSVALLTPTLSSNNWEAFIAKYDTNGNYQWAFRVGSAAFGSGMLNSFSSVTTDDNGDIYVFGSFDGSVDFDPGPGITKLTADIWGDYVFAKYDKQGNFKWCFGETNNGVGGITCSKLLYHSNSNSIYLSLIFDNSCDIDFTSSTISLSELNGNIVLANVDTSGVINWFEQMGNYNSDTYLRDFVLDSVGNVYLCGSFEERFYFNTSDSLTGIGGTDGFFGKIDHNGAINWFKSTRCAFVKKNKKVVL